MIVDTLIYRIKHYLPPVYDVLYFAARGLAAARHFRGRTRAYRQGEVRGTVAGKTTVIRPLNVGDVDMLHGFISGLPNSHFRFFRPHGFSETALKNTVRSSAFACYGVFREGAIIGYCLIKLFPTRNAYVGLIVAPDFVGIKLGKYLWRYLIWQSMLMGVKAHATVHTNNIASLGSLRSVQSDIRTSSLPGDYQRITISTSGFECPPELNL